MKTDRPAAERPAEPINYFNGVDQFHWEYMEARKSSLKYKYRRGDPVLNMQNDLKSAKLWASQLPLNDIELYIEGIARSEMDQSFTGTTASYWSRSMR